MPVGVYVRKRRSISEALLPRVDRSGGDDACWPFTGTRGKNGYGQLRVNGGRIYAHRAALELSTGEKLQPGVCVLHRCDNPPCCNPAHLFPGNQSDNVADMLSKGRNGHGPLMAGAGHPMARLSESEVSELRQLSMRGLGCVRLSSLFGISKSQVKRIVRRENWRHVK